MECCNNTHWGAPHTGKQTICTHIQSEDAEEVWLIGKLWLQFCQVSV